MSFLGLGETAFGVYSAIQTGGLSSVISYAMITDGLARMGLAFNANGPTNLGGVIGSVYGPTGRKWGELTNDGLSAILTGGAFTSAWEAIGAGSAGDYVLGSYFIVEGSSATWDVAQILQNHFVEHQNP